MDAFRLLQTDGPEVVFEGRRVIQRRGECNEGPDGARWHLLAVDRTSEGAWVVSIEYHSTVPAEKKFIAVEMVDSLADVQNVLDVCLPDEHIHEPSLRALPEEVRQKVRRELYENYDRLTAKVIAELQARYGESESVSANRNRPESESNGSRLWQSFTRWFAN